MPVIPNWVDFAVQPQGGTNRRGSFWGPWAVGNNLYAACDHYTGPTVPPNVLRIYKSVDSGITWVEQDVANEPVMQADAICYIRDGTVLRTGRIRPATFDVALRDFDFTTDTWGPDYGLAGSPVIPNLNWDGMLVLASGAFRFFYSRLAGPIRTVYFADFLGGLWSVDNVIFVPVGGTVQSQPGLVYDGALSHGFFSNRPIPPNFDYYHYSITDAGVVTIDALPCYTDQTGNGIFNSIVAAGDLKVSHRAEIGGFYYPALLTGTPAALPIWSTETVELVNGTTAGVWVTEQAGQIRVWWGFSNFGGGPPAIDQFYYSIRGPLIWGAPVTYWDRLLNPPIPDPNPAGFHWQYGPSIAVFPDNITFGDWYGVVIEVDAPIGPMTPLYLRPLGAPPVVATPQGSAGFRRMVILVPNHWDHCLQEHLRIEQHLVQQSLCCQRDTWVDIDNARAPKNFVSRRPTGAIPTPLAASGDVEIFNFRVPTGFDGLITALFHDYTGPGFADGNGDIQWRLQVNRTYAIHLGNVLVRLGSRQRAYGLDGGIQIQSGQFLRYIVNVPNLSGGILPLATQIVAGLEILLYARR